VIEFDTQRTVADISPKLWITSVRWLCDICRQTYRIWSQRKLVGGLLLI